MPVSKISIQQRLSFKYGSGIIPYKKYRYRLFLILFIIKSTLLKMKKQIDHVLF